VTDFGRRAGEGDMLKSVYDADLDGKVGPIEEHAALHQDGGTDEISAASLSGELADDQPPKAHALGGAKHTVATLAELNAKVSDATLDKHTDSRTPTAHKTAHQDGGTDEISVLGLVGTTPRAVLGDATPGRILRLSELFISDGTDAQTLNCQLTDSWNGDYIASTDNIAKGVTTGDFHLSGDAGWLYIRGSGLSALPLMVCPTMMRDTTTRAVSVIAVASGGDIIVSIFKITNGAQQSLTSAVDDGTLTILLLYVTIA